MVAHATRTTASTGRSRIQSRPFVLRHSVKRVMILLSFLIMVCSFTVLILFYALHPQDMHNHHNYSVAKPMATTAKIASPPLPFLTAFVEETSWTWLQSRPLPRRYYNHSDDGTGTIKKLHKFVYPQVQTCRDIPNQWPVDHPIEWDDSKFGPTVGELQPLYPVRFEYAKRFCPIDSDPFLPWIHDVFLVNNNHSKDQDAPPRPPTHVQFIAHNKRRCRSAPVFRETDLKNLEPQVALFQSVSVKRLDNWNWTQQQQQQQKSWLHPHRYRLASLEEADPDGRETRFICQFHSLVQEKGSWKKKIMGETLSIFPFNYEHANFRKGPHPHPLLTRPKDDQDVHRAHNEQVWNSILLFSCPIPPNLQSRLQEQATSTTSNSRRGDGNHFPQLYLDLVPIRTPPRENREGYCPQLQSISSFSPDQEWGTDHVLPPVEASGRWANIPLCPISSLGGPGPGPATSTSHNRNSRAKTMERFLEKSTIATSVVAANKSHYLVGCLWASAVFKTRGKGASSDTSTLQRLLEWLTYHLYIANFDHIYIYDNTEAFTNDTSLEVVTRLFPSDRITRIPWKFRVCNNNPPAHPNAGERSSQYAAEASCRLRFGLDTEWMSFFDTDEYFIPQHNWTDIQSWLRSSVASGAIGPKTHILSLYQTRAVPNTEFMEPFIDNSSRCTRAADGEPRCLAKRASSTFLEAYDCEPTPLPKPDYGFRAMKQIFRPSFVLNHFVHYTSVTQRIHEAPEESSPPFIQRRPYERRVDEWNEAFMLHAKTTTPDATANWKELCRSSSTETKRCPVGIAWPMNEENRTMRSKEGYSYNCYKHDRIQNDLGQRLRRLLKQYKDKTTI